VRRGGAHPGWKEHRRFGRELRKSFAAAKERAVHRDRAGGQRSRTSHLPASFRASKPSHCHPHPIKPITKAAGLFDAGELFPRPRTWPEALDWSPPSSQAARVLCTDPCQAIAAIQKVLIRREAQDMAAAGRNLQSKAGATRQRRLRHLTTIESGYAGWTAPLCNAPLCRYRDTAGTGVAGCRHRYCSHPIVTTAIIITATITTTAPSTGCGSDRWVVVGGVSCHHSAETAHIITRKGETLQSQSKDAKIASAESIMPLSVHTTSLISRAR